MALTLNQQNTNNGLFLLTHFLYYYYSPPDYKQVNITTSYVLKCSESSQIGKPQGWLGITYPCYLQLFCTAKQNERAHSRCVTAWLCLAQPVRNCRYLEILAVVNDVLHRLRRNTILLQQNVS